MLRADAAAPERVVRYRAQTRKMDNGMVYPALFPSEIIRAFENETFDCIHVHHPMFVGPLGVKLGRKYRIPVIYTCHTRYEDYLHYIPLLRINSDSSNIRKKAVGWIRRKVIPSYMRWFADQCDLVLAPSAGMQRVLRGYGMPSSSAVLPTGLEERRFRTVETRVPAIRKRDAKGRKNLPITVPRRETERNY